MTNEEAKEMAKKVVEECEKYVECKDCPFRFGEMQAEGEKEVYKYCVYADLPLTMSYFD